MNAAMTWLSSLTRPWLLLVDQADDLDVSVEDYVPQGDHGFIVQTTRIPVKSMYSSSAYRLGNMEVAEAVDLLLSIVYGSYAWTPSASKSASIIANHLNYVPLALVTAGRTILNGVCTLDSFVAYYETQLIRPREKRDPNSTDEEFAADFRSEYLALCSVYESLAASETNESKDAIQALRVISLYDRVGIETLLSDTDFIDWSRTKPESREAKPGRLILARQLRNPLQSQNLPAKSQSTPAAVLRNIKASVSISEQSLQVALRELRRLLFISFDEASEIYAISPLVRSCLYERDELWMGPPFMWYDTGGYTPRLERRNAFSGSIMRGDDSVV